MSPGFWSVSDSIHGEEEGEGGESGGICDVLSWSPLRMQGSRRHVGLRREKRRKDARSPGAETHFPSLSSPAP